MAEETQIQKMEFDRSGLKDLLSAFLSDPFVKEQHLSELNMEEVGGFFESQQDGTHVDAEGFERAKSHYCLILLELELAGFNITPPEPLQELHNSLRSKNEGFIEIQEEAPEISKSASVTGFEDFVLPGGGRFENSVSKNSGPSSLYKDFRSPAAKIFFEISRSQNQIKSQVSTAASLDMDRLYYQCHIWALECELHSRLHETISHFWPNRQQHIGRVLCQSGHAYDFHPKLKDTLGAFSESHSDLLYEGKLPMAGLLSSLRYMLSTQTLDKFVPAAIDYAVLFFFFSKPVSFGAQLLNNALGIDGMTEGEKWELAARLARLQRLKAKVLNPYSQLSSEVLGLLSEDTTAILKLVLKLKVKPVAALSQEVA